MFLFRCLIPPLLLMLFSLLSCSADGEYPYTIVKGDPCNTRLYTLPGGVKLYITRTAERPRVSAVLYMSAVAGDTLDALYTPSVYSPEYPLLFARIGSEVSDVADYQGSTIVYNDIPSNELENWAVMMLGSFKAFPDTLSVILAGDVVYDDAVAMFIRCFSGVSFFSSSAAACVDDVSLLSYIRTKFADNVSDRRCRKTVTFADIRHNVKSSIELLPSPPAKVVFPDTDKLVVKSVSGQPKMVVAENNDTLFTFTLRTRLKELPAAFLVSMKEYFDTSLNDKKGSAESATHVKIDKNSRSIEFTLSGRVESMKQCVSQALAEWRFLADRNKFYEYLLVNGKLVNSSKAALENIAIQAADYISADERQCGMRAMAKYGMDALFTSSSELFFCGKDAAEAYSLLLGFLNPAATPGLSNFSAAGDTLARFLLLPADIDDVATVTLGRLYESVEDVATIALFNKAVTLSSNIPTAVFYPNGALLNVGTRVPFTRETFDAAKSFLLYECSANGCDALSLIKEYGSCCEQGYTSSQFYDALMQLSFSDVEDFYVRHNENATTQLIICRESCLNVYELTTRGRVVHLTFDELFGY